MIKLELSGKRFSRLLVIKGVRVKGVFKWLCKCDCGKETIKRGADIKRGFVKSCGCLNREQTIQRNTTHGLSHTRFYRIWQVMKDRSLNPLNYRYKYYGGRGIKVCKEWYRFEKFRDDMFTNYKEHCKKHGIKNTSIDRIDVNGNYKLSNCRWATQKEQVHNRRK